MAWMASNLYLNCDDAARAAEALARLLERGQHRTDQGGILDPPGPAVVTPASAGWVAVTRAGAWVDDLPWAATALSRDLEVRCLSLEIFGSCYRARVVATDGSEEHRLIRTPDHGWTGAMDDPRDMPLYEDVEKLAFQILLDKGVPPVLITVGTTPLGYAKPSQLLGTGFRVQLEAGHATREPQETWVVPYALDDPPTLPMSQSRDFGLMLFEERYVDGSPGGPAVDRLLEIEEALRNRAIRACPDDEVSLTVSYFASVHQDRLDSLLRERNRQTLSPDQRLNRPPWWAFWRHLGRFG